MSTPFRSHSAQEVVAYGPTSQAALVIGVGVPADSAAGYDVGCLVIQTDGTDGTNLYVNQGSTTSADFNVVVVDQGAQTITGDKTFSGTTTLATAAITALTVGGANVAPASRVVNVTASATALSLTQTDHAERLVVLPVITGAGLTITLPAATGTGNKYTILNNGVQTVSVTVTALAGDIMNGLARGWHLTAGANDAFAPTAADIKYTFNITTTGGDGGDYMELYDIATDKWWVNVDFFGSGTLISGFA